MFRNPLTLAIRDKTDSELIAARIMASTLGPDGERQECLVAEALLVAKQELDAAIARHDTPCATKMTKTVNALERILAQYDTKKKDGPAGADSKIFKLLED